MSMILTNKQDKNRSIDVIDLVMKHFMYPAVDPQARHNLAQHIKWMRRQSQDMKVDLRFETFPATQGTVITLAIGFETNAITVRPN